MLSVSSIMSDSDLIDANISDYITFLFFTIWRYIISLQKWII